MNENDTPALPTNMLVFNNMDELLSASTKVSNMTEDELDAYEIQNEYKSFGRMAEHVYYGIDLDSFTSEQVMLDFLEANKDYITLETEDNGEFTARPAFHDNMYKHLINEDKMFEVDGLVYKVFQDGMVSAPKDQMNELLDLSSDNLTVIQSTNYFTYVPFQSVPLTKAEIYNDSQAHEAGKNRVRITVKVYSGDPYLHCYVEIDRKKLLGWFARERKLELTGIVTFNSSPIGVVDVWVKTTCSKFKNDYAWAGASVKSWNLKATTPETGATITYAHSL